MPWRGLEGDRDVFAVTLETGDYVGLVWYSFRLEGLDGRREELGPFQLTVYDGAEEVPAWFGEASPIRSSLTASAAPGSRSHRHGGPHRICRNTAIPMMGCSLLPENGRWNWMPPV